MIPQVLFNALLLAGTSYSSPSQKRTADSILTNGSATLNVTGQVYGLPTSPALEQASNLTSSNVSDVRAGLPHVQGNISMGATPDKVTLRLTNTYSSTLYVCTDLSFVGPYASNDTISVTDSSGTRLKFFDFGLSIFDGLVPPKINISDVDLRELAPNASISRELIVPNFWNIPADGNYSITLQAVLIGSTSRNQSLWGNASTYTIAVDSVPTNISLKRSPEQGLPGLEDRKLQFMKRSTDAETAFEITKLVNTNPDALLYGCSDEDTALVQRALKEVVRLAADAGSDTDPQWDWMRKRYYGSTWQTDSDWKTVFNNIAAWNISQPRNPLRFFCDRLGTIDTKCKSQSLWSTLFYTHPIAFEQSYVHPWGDGIVLCSAFFELPEYNPWFPSDLWAGETPNDHSTVLLHEMTHSNALHGKLATTDVPDRSWFSTLIEFGTNSGGCYRYSCTVGLARSPWDDLEPWQNAQNFALYAKSIRDCRAASNARPYEKACV